MKLKANWSDLAPRVFSAMLLLVVGGAALVIGGIFFNVLVLALVGVIHWEIGRMLTPLSRQSFWFSALFAVGTLALLLTVHSIVWSLAILIVSSLAQRSFFHQFKTSGMFFSLAIIACGYVLISLREDFGISVTLWLIGVVVMTDIAGYFAGRIFGGPKFWPRFSPKKTWSGAIGGWAAAGLFSYAFTEAYDLHRVDEWIVVFAVFISFASQMGDIAQSALKRACGVKDSSNLIPGHGGFFDRFDGVIGASVVFGILAPWMM